jgi:8-amino-7-oxononanoate synthase
MEAAFARFVGAESALYFSSGYAANLALLTTLATRHDLVLYDERSHASWYDAVHTTHAKSARFKHNDLHDLKRKLALAADARTIFIVIESVYSMDGDTAPIMEFARISAEAGAVLIVDEAHATGVIGPHAAGLTAAVRTDLTNVITVHTCGKALGSAGAVVAASDVVKEYLVNSARQFIFTTALPPIVALQVMHAIELLSERGDELVAALRDRSTSLRSMLRQRLTRWSVPDGITPIIPVIVGSEKEALTAAQMLRDAGFDVPAIRPPTVAVGTSRLRLNVSLTHTDEELAAVGNAIISAEKEVTK